MAPVACILRKDGRLNSPDAPKQEYAALRERVSTLNAAFLRIGATLDLDTVLKEVVDGAHALNGSSTPPVALGIPVVADRCRRARSARGAADNDFLSPPLENPSGCGGRPSHLTR